MVFGPYRFSRRYPTTARRGAIWLLALGQTIAWAGLYYSFAAHLHIWHIDLAWPKAQLTVAITVALLLSAAFAPIAGRVVDTGRGRWALTFGALAGAAALATLAFARSQATFVLIWSAIGVAQAFTLYDACFAFVTRTMGTEARGAITRITLAAGFASTIAFPLSSALAAAIGWRSGVVVIAAVVAVVGAPASYLGATILERCAVPVERVARRRAQHTVFRRIVRQREFWLLAAAFPLIGLTAAMILTHTVPIFVASSIPERTAVAAAAVFGPMQVAGRLLLLRAGKRVNARTVTVIAFVGITAATATLFALRLHVLFGFLFAAVFGAFFGLISIIKPVVVADVLGTDSFGQVNALVSVPVLVSFAIGPTVGSVLADSRSYTIAVAFGVLTAVAGTTCVVVLAFLPARELTHTRQLTRG